MLTRCDMDKSLKGREMYRHFAHIMESEHTAVFLLW